MKILRGIDFVREEAIRSTGPEVSAAAR